MTAHHGNTPANWTGVSLGLIAFTVSGIGLMAGSMLVFWIGLILTPIGLLVGVAMNRMGIGTGE